MARPQLPKSGPIVIWGGIGALLLALILGLYLISEDSISLDNASDSSPTQAGPVDQSQYETARKLAELAATEQEKIYAVAALRAADHELDKAFAIAIKNSSAERQTLSGPALELSHKIDDLRVALKKDESEIASLNADSASDNNLELSDHRQLTQAQLALDNDSLDNLQLDLARIGGNKQQLIQQAFDQHRSTENQAANLPETSELLRSKLPRLSERWSEKSAPTFPSAIVPRLSAQHAMTPKNRLPL